ncbi:uncharacterized protein METZ01_LOCUS116499, partial [marine metagenome]
MPSFLFAYLTIDPVSSKTSKDSKTHLKL